MNRRVLVVERPAATADVVSLLAEIGWTVQRVSDAEALAAEAPRCRVGIAVLDDCAAFRRAGLFRAIVGADLEWIGIAPPGAVDDPACAQLLCGFFDYLTLPVDAERLRFVLGHALGKAQLRERQLWGGAGTANHGMVGTSVPMQQLYRTIDKVAPADAPVLIRGESGTGKELAAQAIHRGSVRRDGPFVAVNCGAIPSSLIQSQLFGHEKGSFTSAHRREIGSLEAACGGTLFLDEIGDLPLEAQASLLRFLQESTITRVGSTQSLKLDVRVVAATHVDLVAAVRERRFREDLFYRLNVLRVEIPPLRVRGDDIEAHARHVLARYRRDASPALLGFSEAALAAMRSHSWPGNVRELVNRVHGAMILCEGAWITPADLGLDSAPRSIGAISLAGARQSSERELVLAALQRNTHNVSATARELGVSRVTVYRLARRLSIETKAKPERPARGQTLGGYG
ncbi:MAG: sigma-54-dependent Fis family transcriptional regulator [Burkholderiaceae bacterium]|nr:sigma-54-dependent Fis family transcriptional regulator [Burkholderiaceae bacterium]